MGQALYRKYRSRSLSEIVGQSHVTDTLATALKSGRISHAYLFTGPRGVGKTSIARILAHEINGLEYSDDTSHLDIIEIDAASNRGIDEIRELREKVYIAPAVGKYKVYIIDEVHMLTTQAFNALLKTLEEPPAHVVFILATTEAHKLPATIISRTQRYTFRPAQPADVIDHLRSIAAKEKITIDDNALKLIAEHGDGSFRDSVGILDQATQSSKSITAEAVQRLLGLPPHESIEQLLTAVESGNATELSRVLASLYNTGYQAGAITKQLSQELRNRILSDSLGGLTRVTTLKLLKEFLDVPLASDPGRLLEIILLTNMHIGETQVPNVDASPPVPQTMDTFTPAAAAAPAVKKQDPSVSSPPKPTAKAAEQKPASKTQSEASGDSVKKKNGSLAPVDATFVETIWPNVLIEIKKSYNTLYSILRMASPVYEDDCLKLGFAFPFHQKRINEAKNKQVIVTIIEQLTGQGVEVKCIVEEKKAPEPEASQDEPAPTTAKQPDPLKNISSVFGGGELL